jgi:hypothetical protein
LSYVGVDFEDVTGGELVTAAVEEKERGHAEEMALGIDLGGQRGDGFLAGGVSRTSCLAWSCMWPPTPSRTPEYLMRTVPDFSLWPAGRS